MKKEFVLRLLEDKELISRLCEASGCTERVVRTWYKHSHKNGLRYNLMTIIAERFNVNINELVQ